MSGFDVVFALFGLVLGLAITEVLAGFSRVLKMRRDVHVGWLVPLLGIVILLDLTAFWSQAYDMRDVLPGNYLTLIVMLAIVGSYYLIATLIFPDQPDRWPDFDAYYDEVNRKVLGGMLTINFVTLIASGIAFAIAPATKGSAADDPIGTWSTVFELAPVLLIPVTMIVKHRRANVILLAILALDFVAQAIAESV